ncbi:MAG TPA: glycosyltransferase family 2 protein [Candidatus Deferrimicrobiaceae bacterium]|nr:glycosyltransferase family 2 protein [Candidatus Deferrimicrobiaceae bacterium]
MILAILNFFFVCSALIICLYIIRHYIFTLTVLRASKRPRIPPATEGYEPSVTILIPAHNEEKVIGRLLKKMSELSYPKSKLQVIIIDDASTDQTGQIADAAAKDNRIIRVLHRSRLEGGNGKASALNSALKQATGEVVLCFDADYLPHSEIVQRLVAKFADPKVGAVQGRPVVLNEPQNSTTRIVALERIGGYRVDQEARELLGLVPQFGGTVGGFRRSILESIGGFDESMLTEDTDITFQIYLAGYKVSYAGDAECYEEAVENWKAYWRQRHRWAKGHMQVAFKYFTQVLLSKNMRLREKIDGVLLLNIYFLPLLTIFSFASGLFLILSGEFIVSALWFTIIMSFYSFVGNYAPFFEIGVGVYLDGRRRVHWLAPLMIFSFLYNVLICGKAFVDILWGKIAGYKGDWEKTEHNGSGNRLIENSMVPG